VDDYVVIETPLFPKISGVVSKKKYTVMLGVGSNINKPLQTIHRLYFFLMQDKFLDISCSFCILKNPPFGYIEQPDFFNTLLLIKTNLSPMRLLKRVLWIEKRFQRRRFFKNSPRTLDLDVIFFENLVIYSKQLVLPHPEYKNRASVLIPMTYKRSKLQWKK